MYNLFFCHNKNYYIKYCVMNKTNSDVNTNVGLEMIDKLFSWLQRNGWIFFYFLTFDEVKLVQSSPCIIAEI